MEQTQYTDGGHANYPSLQCGSEFNLINKIFRIRLLANFFYQILQIKKYVDLCTELYFKTRL